MALKIPAGKTTAQCFSSENFHSNKHFVFVSRISAMHLTQTWIQTV
jgi:hypothetical protein